MNTCTYTLSLSCTCMHLNGEAGCSLTVPGVGDENPLCFSNNDKQPAMRVHGVGRPLRFLPDVFQFKSLLLSDLLVTTVEDSEESAEAWIMIMWIEMWRTITKQTGQPLHWDEMLTHLQPGCMHHIRVTAPVVSTTFCTFYIFVSLKVVYDNH